MDVAVEAPPEAAVVAVRVVTWANEEVDMKLVVYELVNVVVEADVDADVVGM